MSTSVVDIQQKYQAIIADNLFLTVGIACDIRFGAECPQTEDLEFTLDFNWEKVSCKRHTSTVSLLNEGHPQLRVLLLSITCAPIRYIANWAIFRTHPSHCGTTPLQNLTAKMYSPFVRAMQHLGSLFGSDPHDRFFSILMFSGPANRHDFVANHSMSRTVRSAIMSLYAWLWWRSRKYSQVPLVAARLGDLRLTWSDRFGTANYIFSLRRCCLDPGCFRKIALRISSAVQYLDKRQLDISAAIAAIWIHNGPIECLHARNQVHNSPTNCWGSLVAKFILSHARQLQARATRQRDMFLKALMPPAKTEPLPVDDDSGEPEMEMCAGTSAVGVLFHQTIRTQRATGTTENSSSGLWKQVEDEFENNVVKDEARLKSLENVARYNNSQHRHCKHTKSPKIICDKPATTDLALLSHACVPCGEGPDGATLIPQEVFVPRLEDDAKCMHCDRLGMEHEPPVVLFGDFLRLQSRQYKSMVAKGGAQAEHGLSDFPLSVERCAVERSRWQGGLEGLARRFDASLQGVARPRRHRSQAETHEEMPRALHL